MGYWWLLVLLLVSAGCSSSTDPAAEETPGSRSQDDPLVVTNEPVVLTPGAAAVGSVTIDDTEIEYVTVVPDDFERGDQAPVVLAMPPGQQDIGLTERIVEATYLNQALDRGWVVISPAAPNGQLYFNGSEVFVPGLLDWVGTWVQPEADRIHLLGVSNGGISSFRIAGLSPERFRSVVVFPGFPRSDDDRAALDDLASTPIRMFVGENDTGWVGEMVTTEETLAELGGDVSLEVIPDEGHIIESLGDGQVLFDTLDSLR